MLNFATNSTDTGRAAGVCRGICFSCGWQDFSVMTAIAPRVEDLTVDRERSS